MKDCPDCAARETETRSAQANEARLGGAIVWGIGSAFLLGGLVSAANAHAGVITLLVVTPTMFLLAYWRRLGVIEEERS